jgi:hypothetical protein
MIGHMAIGELLCRHLAQALLLLICRRPLGAAASSAALVLSPDLLPFVGKPIGHNLGRHNLLWHQLIVCKIGII